MNRLIDIINNRRSTRKFSDKDIEPDQLALILQAGLTAPSSRNSRPWHFLVVEGEELLHQISLCRENGTIALESAKVAIVVAADPTQSGIWIEDAAIAASYMQLQAEELGIGSCWIQIRGRLTADNEQSEDYLQNLLGIPETISILCVIALGHPLNRAEAHSPEELMWERIHINNWDKE